jgi:hypothetical protein
MTALVFLRLVDGHMLSLTNIGVIVVLVRIASSRQATVSDLAALLLTLLAYQHKKILGEKQKVGSEALQESLKTALAASQGVAEVQNTLSGMGEKIAALNETVTAIRNRGVPAPTGVYR